MYSEHTRQSTPTSPRDSMTRQHQSFWRTVSRVLRGLEGPSPASPKGTLGAERTESRQSPVPRVSGALAERTESRQSPVPRVSGALKGPKRTESRQSSGYLGCCKDWVPPVPRVREAEIIGTRRTGTLTTFAALYTMLASLYMLF